MSSEEPHIDADAYAKQVEPIFEGLLQILLLQTPDDPIPTMIKFLETYEKKHSPTIEGGLEIGERPWQTERLRDTGYKIVPCEPYKETFGAVSNVRPSDMKSAYSYIEIAIPPKTGAGQDLRHPFQVKQCVTWRGGTDFKGESGVSGKDYRILRIDDKGEDAIRLILDTQEPLDAYWSQPDVYIVASKNYDDVVIF